MHARFSNQQKFGDVLIDLCDMLCSSKRVISFCDAVIGMEGNGPSGGTPRKVGCLLVSENPYALDLAASQIICHDGEVPMIEEAKRRGLCPKEGEIRILEMTLILSELRIIFILTQKGERYFPCCGRFCSRNRMLFCQNA